MMYFISRNLSDVDKDGQLNIEEFALAMHLVEMAKSGKPLPQTVPQELMPPSFQGRALSDSVTSVGGTEGRERSGSTRSRSGSSSDPICKHSTCSFNMFCWPVARIFHGGGGAHLKNRDQIINF